MSGQSATFPAPLTLGTIPPEGSKGVRVTVNWDSPQVNVALGYSFPINMLAQYQSGQFTSVQAIFVDNSNVPFAVQINCEGIGQAIWVPPFSQGMFPIFVSQAPIFTVNLQVLGAPGTLLKSSTDVTFLNTPQSYYVNTQPPFGNGFGTLLVTAFLTTTNFVNILPPLMSQRYLISGVQITLSTLTGWPTTQFVPVTLSEDAGSSSPIFWEDAFLAIANTPTLYSKFVPFTPAFMPTIGLTVALNVLGTPLVPPGGLNAYVTTSYGIVTVA
jgi:hypothetical protein